ncbi:MAG: hypothetical protein FWF88_12045 [Peptococcaceae bacterium]|nr:hypothetical protein [Peptococcaceae bacterium]
MVNISQRGLRPQEVRSQVDCNDHRWLQIRPQPEGQEGAVDNGQWTIDNGQ